MVKSKAAAVDVRIPQNRDEAAAMLAEFGAVSRQIEAIETAMKEKLATVKTDAEKEAAPYADKAKQLFAGLKLFCEANRQTLLGDTGLKTADLGTGTVSWRWNPAKVTLRGEVEDIIKRILEKAGEAITRGGSAADYMNFIRTKQEIDRDAMLKHPDLARTIEGVSVGRGGEMFIAEPFGAELSEAAE